ncbi:ABC transporter ATP-binding protein [Kaistia geumhonensis]|uniref:Multiple sugar transport system ATP-binding protein n=1 Tax=Kaistia geumhonensis TaxID=410839 RepID=A0ABU0M755_9HYPH|nr:ABC transporter ATP-binding protein [Kaistia geumhonensis]MCX5477999.1 ABC transporter ATP-binding protein [Kaistia geumhonensis]MDQ0516788.1 multiple sugar transport system ATP-binding protein [Kaistia geumhonensis]
MPDVRFEHIVKRFGTLSVLEDLNLTVADGEFLVLLGPSGCGKTTLLNLLAGLLDVTGGRITIGDRDVTELDPSQRGLAMVFQSYALYPTKTVEGNLRFGLAAQKLDRAEIDRRVAWAAQLLQLERMMNRKPSQLSGGQRQRVAIGRALVKHAGVLLFDEPLSNLDAKLRTEMRLEIKKLHQSLHQTIVYVTHDQIEAMTMATRIAVMDQGVIQQIGTPDEIYERPANLFVARFIGSPAINTFDATLALEGERILARHAPTGIAIDLTRHAFGRRPEQGAPVVIGLRPEHFAVNGAVREDDAVRLSLPVRYSERTGSDATAFLEAGDQLVAIRIEPSLMAGLRIGDAMNASFPGEKLSVFDARSGLRM